MLDRFTGELAGLGAAFVWAVASVVFRRLGGTIPPLTLNLYKGVIASAMLLAVLAARSQLLIALPTQPLLLLGISGAIGIGIGDTAYFGALNRLGERQAVLMAETLAPPIATMIALVFLSEFLSLTAIVGIALAVSGVAWVIVDRTSSTPLETSHRRTGIALGLLAALCQSVGAVMSRAALHDTEVGPLWSSLIRMAGGVLLLLVLIPAGRRSFLPRKPLTLRLVAWIIGATFVGTFLGIFFQQLALKHTSAGVVQTMLATSSLFILPVVAIRGERPGWRAVIGALVSVGGIALLFAAKS